MKKAQDLLSGDQPDEEALKLVCKEMEMRLSSLDELQSDLELIIESESDMLADIEKAGVYRDSVVTVLSNVSKTLHDLRGDSESGVSVSSQSVKLPKLDLPKFGGDVLKWQSFWEMFQASVHDADLPNVTKFSYLRSLLEGEASTCISGLTLSAANYEAACKILSDRFGRTERIIFNHIQQLLSIQAPSAPDVHALRALQDKLLAHVRALESLGVKGEAYGVMMVPVVLQRLPPAIRMEWARDGVGREADLSWLLDFLDAEIGRRERSGAYSQSPAAVPPAADSRRSPAGGRQQRSKPQRTPAAAALSTSTRVCGFCAQAHRSEQCQMLASLNVPQRLSRIREAGLCFRCLQGGHKANRCRVNCADCGGRHHSVCCLRLVQQGHDDVPGGATPQRAEAPRPAVTAVSAEQAQRGNRNVRLASPCGTEGAVTVLPLVRALMRDRHDREVPVNVLFDSASDRSYVTAEVVKQVGPNWMRSESVAYAAFGGASSDVVERDVYELSLTSTDPDLFSTVTMQAIRVPVICAPLHRPSLPASVMVELAHLPMADRPPPDELHVHVLVGMDYFWRLVRPAVHCTQGGPVAQETALGWMVSGLVSDGVRGPQQLGCQLLCLGDLHESRLRNFWELEGIGIVDSADDSSSEVQARFRDSIRMDDGRYEVALPWKRDPGELADNRHSAEVRLSSLARKLGRDPELSEQYDAALSEMEASGVIAEVPQAELVTDNPTFYLPHRPVVKESSTSTRVRPVFDASATDRAGLSLNDCLEVGPNLIPNLCEVLLRFRRWRYAVTGDIRKAFLQIKVRREDQDVLRFLWDVNGQRRTMRFQRVIFGAACSPFLLTATIRHHLASYPVSRAVRELQTSLYMDDFVSGCDTEQGARELLSEAQSILSDAGMELTKCTSNSELVLDRAHALAGSPENECVKVLGLRWLPDRDVFVFDGVHLPGSVVPTKRVLLSLIARLFDPMQWLAPHTMIAKCLFQELWRIGLGWDEIMPPEFSDVFSDWLRGLEVLKRFEIPRTYFSSGWNGGEGVSLHAFGDASLKGYGAVVYVCVLCEDGSRDVSLVMAKAPWRRSPPTRCRVWSCWAVCSLPGC